MDEVHLEVLPPDDGPIGNVHADANQHHPPVITYSQELTMNFYNVKMKHTMKSFLSYEDVMAELHRLIQHQFRVYYNAEKARYGDHPPCSPPPPAAN